MSAFHSEAEELRRQRASAFIARLARALHTYGTPAYRMEEALGRVAERYGLSGQFLSTPTSIIAAFGEVGEQHLVLERVEPGEVELGKLSRLDELLDRIGDGELDTASAEAHLERIAEAPPRYGQPWAALGYGVVAAPTALFFGGGWEDLGLAGLLGVAVGLLAAWVAKQQAAKRLLDLAAGTLAALVAFAAASVGFSVAPQLVTLAAVILLLPGLTITVAVSEVATRHLVAGSARFIGGLFAFVTLAFGVALGSRLGERLVTGELPEPPGRPEMWLEGLALLVAAVGFTVTFQARRTDYGWILLASGLALASSRIGADLLGPELGAFCGAFVVGVAGQPAGPLPAPAGRPDADAGADHAGAGEHRVQGRFGSPRSAHPGRRPDRLRNPGRRRRPGDGPLARGRPRARSPQSLAAPFKHALPARTARARG